MNMNVYLPAGIDTDDAIAEFSDAMALAVECHVISHDKNQRRVSIEVPEQRQAEVRKRVQMLGCTVD